MGRKKKQPREIAGLPTECDILHSLRQSRRTVCSHCVHYKKASDDVFEPLPTCWCASAELIIEWKPSAYRCDFYFDGTAVKMRITEELKWTKATIEEWLNSRKGKKHV